MRDVEGGAAREIVAGPGSGQRIAQQIASAVETDSLLLGLAALLGGGKAHEEGGGRRNVVCHFDASFLRDAARGGGADEARAYRGHLKQAGEGRGRRVLARKTAAEGKERALHIVQMVQRVRPQMKDHVDGL